jgi:hypothetical protein
MISNAFALAQSDSPQILAVLGVDLTGLALGLIFASLARAAARRARHGDPRSVWALASTS